MGLLSKSQYAENLRRYYLEHYGERDTDIWYPQPAVNVWVFGREGKIIALKSHILTGIVTEKREDA
ncbi:MAG: hypothetical protein IKM60_02450 [Clostridia bacterium]|nr:hypothetical protein [Clostridia bacterium]